MKRLPSLRSRIQSSMFRATFISHLIMACILIPTLLSLLIPVGQLMTRGSAAELAQRYTMTDMSRTPKTELDTRSISKMTEQQLIQTILKNNTDNTTRKAEDAEILAIGEKYTEIPQLVVDSNTNDTKRLLLFVSEQYDRANSFFERQLPFFKFYTLEFKVNNYEFNLPNGIDANMPTNSFLVNDLVNKMKTSLSVVDTSGNPIGYVTLGINGNIIAMIIFMYVFLMLVVSLGSLLIVSLLGKLMTKGILKPIVSVNKQLRSMAEEDLETITATALQVKRPPQEIQQLIQSANTILIKMHDNQQLLEAQNEELHTQNEELLNTKEIIQKQQNMLVQNEKMASIGQLSAAIVHEINTPVGAIKSNAQMIALLSQQAKTKHPDPDFQKTLTKIDSLNHIVEQASERVAGIIKSLKSYSRLDQSEFKASNLNEDLQNVILLTSNLWKNRIRIEEHYTDIPMVNCYSGLLNQVFMNLVVNAIDAMESGGTLELSTEQAGEHVVIAIKDTGSGIAPENLERIFEEGFTTKSKHKGSGLGLALSKDIVSKHKGRIEVSSVIGQGSTFSVIIPIDPNHSNAHH